MFSKSHSNTGQIVQVDNYRLDFQRKTWAPSNISSGVIHGSEWLSHHCIASVGSKESKIDKQKGYSVNLPFL